MRKSPKVADESMFGEGNGPEFPNMAPHTRQGFSRDLSILYIIIRAPFSLLSCLSSPHHISGAADGVWVSGEFSRMSDVNHLYDAMIKFPKCVCNASEGFKKHNQLLKLMQFLMGLDDSYMQIRSSILSRETLLDVKSAYATVSSEESHRVAVCSIVGSSQRNQAFAFVSNVPYSQNFQRCQYGSNGKIVDSEANQHITYTAKELNNVLDISHLKIKDSKVGKSVSTNIFQDVNHTNSFDIEYPEIPNDNERVANDLNKGKSDSSSSFVSSSNINTADFPVDFRNDADSSNDFVATQNEEEIDALLRNDTWELVDLSEGRKAIGSKWIYKIKFRSSGEIDRYKARLVAQGLRQKEGIAMRRLSLLWSKWLLLEEVVFMKPPEGYFPFDNTVCRLKKSLYGLKQASRQWNAKLTSTLIENGFSQSKYDHSLYTKSDKGVFLALLVYVDEIIITGNSVFEIEKFKVFCKSKFMIKDLGKLKYFLGIEVVVTDKGICINKRKYVLDLLSEYGMLACKPAKTPLMSKLVISNEASDKDPLLENITDYQKLMGKLIYLINTRLNISYVVHCLSQFMHSPLTSHLKIAFKILRYLNSCPGLGVHVTKISGMFLTAYSDAD
nr:ribonuclease H-like domain-containing protein [Tanacetum cinerariifolium]